MLYKPGEIALFIYLKNKQARIHARYLKYSAKKSWLIGGSIYVQIERFGMLKVKSVQLCEAELQTPASVRPTSFMFAGRCIIRIG